MATVVVAADGAEAARSGARAAHRTGVLRIGILCPPWFPVPPLRYGGIEAVVALLADGLVERGHDVTLFAAGDSRTRARLAAVHDPAPSAKLGQTLPELEHALACLRQADAFDVVSDHAGLLGLALSGRVSAPWVHTVHGALAPPALPVYDAATAFAPAARLVSLSRSQRLPRPGFPWLANVPNAVDLVRFPCRDRGGGDYLLWVGRMCREKRPDRAIEVARQAGLPLFLAGKMHTRAERDYFRRRVRPRLGAGVEYVGEADTGTVVDLLHGAIALLNPIDWAEPFGLVMIEALACGVPVLATRRGSVPEVVDHGVTGFVVDDWRDLAAAVPAAAAISPRTCRLAAEERFSPGRMVDGYLAAFRGAIAPPGAKLLGSVAMSTPAWHGKRARVIEARGMRHGE